MGGLYPTFAGRSMIGGCAIPPFFYCMAKEIKISEEEERKAELRTCVQIIQLVADELPESESKIELLNAASRLKIII